MLIKYFLIVLQGFLAGMVFVFLFRRLSLRYRILIPQGIPLIGGIAMGLSFIFSSLVGFSLFGGLSQEARGIIIASFIMLAFGVIDDWGGELSILAKFLVQIIATALLILFGITIITLVTLVSLALTKQMGKVAADV